MKKQTKYTSKQQIFNKVWKHFIVEKNPKSVEGDSCTYYSESGGCAIGCLIGDDKDKKQFDLGLYSTIDYIRKRYTNSISRYISGNIPSSFLVQLQTIHDSYFNEFESKMRAFADSHGLKVPKAAKTK